MSTYKVIQDIEAEDKLVGPLSLRQFIYAGIAALLFYLSFLAITKHAGLLAILFVPIGAASGFFAFPWGKDQPTEVWALAKIRFFIKPRKRIWDQSGAKELVTITVPKKIQRMLTNGLDLDEVNSRLNALASTIDSRGWAIKNVNMNMYPQGLGAMASSDRLVAASTLPQEVANVDVRPSDDILDESANAVAHHFDDMIQAAGQAKRQQLMTQMQQPSIQASPSPQMPAPAAQQHANNYWFMDPPAATAPAGQAIFSNAPMVAPGAGQMPSLPQAAIPTAEEQAMVEKFKAENASQTIAYGHMKMVKTVEERMEDEARARVAAEQAKMAAAAKPPVTVHTQAAIINFAQNDDLDVATIARQAKSQLTPQAQNGSNDEVVISLR